MNKDMRKLVAKARAQGWKIEHGSRHLILVPPDPSRRKVPIPIGDSKGNAVLTPTLVRLRRSGLVA